MTPRFLYGTAWKEERTARLTRQALDSGFRAIDTANQRKHYFEAAVGEAIASAIADGVVTRDALFLQSKFTHRAGQDQRLPYDERAPIGTQVAQSFQSSLEHLHTDRLDSYVLHGPSGRSELSREDWQVWEAMTALHAAGKTTHLGISNVAASHLAGLLRDSKVKPAFVQNRCYARTGWDREVRALCRAHGIVYQGFSLLTANRHEMQLPAIAGTATRRQLTPAQIVFAFALAVGMLPITGSSDALHLKQDLAALDLTLTADEVAAIEKVGL